MKTRSDAEIVQIVLEGDKNSYALLVNAHGERIINYLARMTGNRYEAEDLAQDAFVRAYIALPSYNPEYKFSTWLFKIATNLCLNYLKKRNRTLQVEDYQGDEGQPLWVVPDTRPQGDPLRATQRRETQRSIQAAIDQLSPAYRMVVILRHVQGLTYQEIVEVTGLPMGTVKSRLGRGRARLAKLLQGKL